MNGNSHLCICIDNQNLELQYGYMQVRTVLFHVFRKVVETCVQIVISLKCRMSVKAIFLFTWNTGLL